MKSSKPGMPSFGGMRSRVSDAFSRAMANRAPQGMPAPQGAPVMAQRVPAHMQQALQQHMFNRDAMRQQAMQKQQQAQAAAQVQALRQQQQQQVAQQQAAQRQQMLAAWANYEPTGGA